MTTLYKRLGGMESIHQIASDIVSIHFKHPYTQHRYSAKQIPKVQKETAKFMATITGGPKVFDTQTLNRLNRCLDMEETEFVSVLDDTLTAMQKNQVPQREQEEVLFMLYQLKHSFTLN